MVAVTGAADSTGGGGVDDNEQRCSTKVDEVHSNQTTETVLLNGYEAKKIAVIVRRVMKMWRKWYDMKHE